MVTTNTNGAPCASPSPATPIRLVAGRYRPDDAIPWAPRTSSLDTAPLTGDDSLAYHRDLAKQWTARATVTRADGTTRSYRTATCDDAAELSPALYSALWCIAFGAARRVAMIAGTSKKDVSTSEAPIDRVRTSSTPHELDVRDESEDVASESVLEVWALATKGRASRPFGLAAVIARRLAMRRSQHRIRMRSGITDAPTDGTLPAIDAGKTLLQLAAALPASRRSAWLYAMDSTLAGSVRRDNGIRTLRTLATAIDAATVDAVFAGEGEDDNDTPTVRFWLDDKGHVSVACCEPIAMATVNS